jgi:glycosyltransferase involved in cell wall biosynthesis
MSKPILVFQAPIGTRSGYGERSRDLVRSLIELDKYDVKIVSTRWGSTPMNALSEADQDILSRIVTGPLQTQPDIYVQVTVPNEFQRIGKFNIGVTAGIETDICDPSWIEGCNRMDLILVSSNHAKQSFENSVYEKRDQNTNQSLGMLRIEKPIEVLFEGVQLNKFKKTYEGNTQINEVFKDIKEDFCFLFVGHWLPGDFGEDRKNVAALIRTFYESFKGKQNAPALVLKTSGGTYSVTDRTAIESRINAIKKSVDSKLLPNVYVVYGDLDDNEMSELYNHSKIKAHVTFTKGEGYGRPLAEAAVTGKPIIASKHSGHLDFLSEDFASLINGQLTNVHPSASWKGVLNTESKWFTVDYGHGSAFMKDVFKNYKIYLEKSRKSYHHIKTNFSFEAMKEKLDSILTSRIPEFPKQVQLNLPKLKKIDTSVAEVPKITLPKLKKIESEDIRTSEILH